MPLIIAAASLHALLALLTVVYLSCLVELCSSAAHLCSVCAGAVCQSSQVSQHNLLSTSCKVTLTLSVQVNLMFARLSPCLTLCMCVSAALNEDPTYFNGTGNTTFGRASICTTSEEEENFCLSIAALFNSSDTGFGWTCDVASNVTAGCPASVASGQTDLTVSLPQPLLVPLLGPLLHPLLDPPLDPLPGPLPGPLLDPLLSPLLDPLPGPLLGPLPDPVLNPLLGPLLDPGLAALSD